MSGFENDCISVHANYDDDNLSVKVSVKRMKKRNLQVAVI
jgi:hypothetical protein